MKRQMEMSSIRLEATLLTIDNIDLLLAMSYVKVPKKQAPRFIGRGPTCVSMWDINQPKNLSSSCFLVVECTYEAWRGPIGVSMWDIIQPKHLSSSYLLVLECSYEGQRGPTGVSMWDILQPHPTTLCMHVKPYVARVFIGCRVQLRRQETKQKMSSHSTSPC